MVRCDCTQLGRVHGMIIYADPVVYKTLTGIQEPSIAVPAGPQTYPGIKKFSPEKGCSQLMSNINTPPTLYPCSWDRL